MSTARRSFTFERSKVYTGKVQFRADGPARVSTDKGDWLRGEVKAIKSERYANALVEGGMHAHVAADAPVGLPVAPVDPAAVTHDSPPITNDADNGGEE